MKRTIMAEDCDNNDEVKIELNRLAITFKNEGDIYLEEKEYAKAILAFNQAITLNGYYSSAYNNRGYANFAPLVVLNETEQQRLLRVTFKLRVCG